MAELVIPSAQKKDFTMREKALTCLGLTSLISRVLFSFRLWALVVDADRVLSFVDVVDRIWPSARSTSS